MPCAPSHARSTLNDALLRAPWNALDDAALLAHFRSERGIRFEPVIDADEVAPQRMAGIMAGRFEFNGEVHALPQPIDWLTNPSRDVEWHILLHKFYYAVGFAQAWQREGDARAVQRWTQLIDGWMAQTPVGFIAADVTGRRVQNWIYSLHAILLNTAHPAPIDAAFLRRLLHSIHAQVEFLCTNLTPKRNHRTLELLAIFLAGVVFPEFERAAAWRELALHETLANVRADLLPDGVHCELSTDYHHLAVRNWLQVRRLAADNGYGVPCEFDRALEAALEFSLHVHQPSGSMPSLSDGDVRSFLPLLAQGAALFDRGDMQFVATGGRQGTPPRQRVAHFPLGGYHVLRSDWHSAGAQHLVFDCGPLGEGNHGHFDALSFELAANGRALIVDPGRYTYSEALDDDRNWRVHFRSTAAHNTVGVDGLNQTRYVPKAIKEASRHAHGSVRHKISGPAPETTLSEAFGGTQLDLLHGRCASHEYDAMHRALHRLRRSQLLDRQRLAARADRARLPAELPARRHSTWPDAAAWRTGLHAPAQPRPRRRAAASRRAARAGRRLVGVGELRPQTGGTGLAHTDARVRRRLRHRAAAAWPGHTASARGRHAGARRRWLADPCAADRNGDVARRLVPRPRCAQPGPLAHRRLAVQRTLAALAAGARRPPAARHLASRRVAAHARWRCGVGHAMSAPGRPKRECSPSGGPRAARWGHT